jgi:hypothetical protein
MRLLRLHRRRLSVTVALASVCVVSLTGWAQNMPVT